MCYKPCVIMKNALINSVFAVMLLCSPGFAGAVHAETAEESISAAATQAMAAANAGAERLAELLVQVEDASSAAALLPQIEAALESIRMVDEKAFAEDDEEMVAAEFIKDWYLLVEDEVARLMDAGFYGNEQLRRLLDAPDAADEAFDKPALRTPAAAEAPAQEAATESLLPRR